MDTYAIALYFDKVSADTLQGIINNVALISNNNYMIDVNIPPHITIGSFLSDECSGIMTIMEDFVKHLVAFDVEFDKINAFEPRVLFASPIKDAYLMRYNRLVHDLFSKHFMPADNEYYTPDKWIPHCALAVKLDKAQFKKAMTIQKNIDFPIIANVQKIALARCNPYKEIKVWEINRISISH